MSINLIYGPPGTGKTTYLLELLKGLLKKYKPVEIAYVSYTKKGSYEGRDRALKKFNYNERDFPYFRTLHSIAFRQLNISRMNMINKSYYKTFSDKMGMKFTGFYTEEFKNDDDKYLFFDILHRNNSKAASKYLYDMDTYKLRFIRHNYDRFKKHMNIYDYTDLLEKYITEGRTLPVKIAIIDEAQDLTTLQWKMIWKAFSGCEDIFIAGDDDQAIYEWSGADVNYFLSVNGNVSTLRKSYRLPENILQFSKNITELIEHRVEKEFHGTEKTGQLNFISELDELNINKNESYLMLARNNWFLQEYEKWCMDNCLVYTKRGISSVSDRDISAIREYSNFKMVRDEKHMSITLRARLKKNYNIDLEWYDNFDLPKEKIIYYKNLLRNKIDLSKSNIEIGTIHSVKGGEADNVILMTDVTKNVRKNIENNPDSEHRVFYVGITRTRKNLFILNSRSKNEYIFYRRPHYE